MLFDWYEITKDILTQSLKETFNILLNLLGAIIVFLIGWFIAWFIGKTISEIFRRIGFNRIFEKGSWKTALDKAEIKIDASAFVGLIFQWILIIVFLTASLKILGLTDFSDFLKGILNYLPNVIVAALVLVVAGIISDILEKTTKSAIEGAKLGRGQIAGLIIKWSIWIFAVLLVLIQLGIGKELILTLFSGLVALIAISGGLAFGLGGKEIAADILKKIKIKLEK